MALLQRQLASALWFQSRILGGLSGRKGDSEPGTGFCRGLWFWRYRASHGLLISSQVLDYAQFLSCPLRAARFFVVRGTPIFHVKKAHLDYFPSCAWYATHSER